MATYDFKIVRVNRDNTEGIEQGTATYSDLKTLLNTLGSSGYAVVASFDATSGSYKTLILQKTAA